MQASDLKVATPSAIRMLARILRVEAVMDIERAAERRLCRQQAVDARASWRRTNCAQPEHSAQ